MYVCVYMYIYIERERQREKEKERYIDSRRVDDNAITLGKAVCCNRILLHLLLNRGNMLPASIRLL